MGSIWCTSALLKDPITQPMPFASPTATNPSEECIMCEKEKRDKNDTTSAAVEPPTPTDDDLATAVTPRPHSPPLPTFPSVDMHNDEAETTAIGRTTEEEPSAGTQISEEDSRAPTKAPVEQPSALTTESVPAVPDDEHIPDQVRAFLRRCGHTFHSRMLQHIRESGKPVSNAIFSQQPSSDVLIVLLVDSDSLQNVLTLPEVTVLTEGEHIRRLGYYRDGRTAFTCPPELLRQCFTEDGEQVSLSVKDYRTLRSPMPLQPEESTAVVKASEQFRQGVETSKIDLTAGQAPFDSSTNDSIKAPTHNSAFLALCGLTFQRNMLQYLQETGKHVEYAFFVDPGLLEAFTDSLGRREILVIIANFETYDYTLREAPETAAGVRGTMTRTLGFYHNGQTIFRCSPDHLRPFFMDDGGRVSLQVVGLDEYQNSERAMLEDGEQRQAEEHASDVVQPADVSRIPFASGAADANKVSTTKDLAFVETCGQTLHRYIMQHTLETGELIPSAFIGALEPLGCNDALIILGYNLHQLKYAIAKPANGMRNLGFYHDSRTTFTCGADICRIYFTDHGEQVKLQVHGEKLIQAYIRDVRASDAAPMTTTGAGVEVASSVAGVKDANIISTPQHPTGDTDGGMLVGSKDAEEDLIDLTDGDVARETDMSVGASSQGAHRDSSGNTDMRSTWNDQLTKTPSHSEGLILEVDAQLQPCEEAKEARLQHPDVGSNRSAEEGMSPDQLRRASPCDVDLTETLVLAPSASLNPTLVLPAPSPISNLTQLHPTDLPSVPEQAIDHTAEGHDQPPTHILVSLAAKMGEPQEVFSHDHESTLSSGPNALQHLQHDHAHKEVDTSSSFDLQFGETSAAYLQDNCAGSWSMPTVRPTFYDLGVTIICGPPSTLQFMLEHPFTSIELRCGLRLAYSTLQHALTRSAILRLKIEHGIDEGEKAALRLGNRISSLSPEDGLFDVPADAAKKTILGLALARSMAEKAVDVMGEHLAIAKKCQLVLEEKERKDAEDLTETVAEAVMMVCWLAVLAVMYVLCTNR
ncbi:hypothetical protein LTR36_000320 [Oleoguttula mirabilis]|uniref:Uncharacterized protein n=1 Tax=Oleoguttula mirabilis TaxID=1507867 RepID=A0AAV9JY73_9PEZI|nr:hypothetical protein LTR36_000320 [Oleoguttula mirabilis]